MPFVESPQSSRVYVGANLFAIYYYQPMDKINPQELKNQFIAWQCRIRQYSVRKEEGMPLTGMRPVLEAKNQSVGPINIQLVLTDSVDSTREFRFLIQKTEDPKSRYDEAIKILAEYYYQIPADFDEEMTAIYSLNSELADQLVEIGECTLHFDQGNQIYHLRCAARFIDQDDLKYQATYWHNHLFNPSLPGQVNVIGFKPDWNNSYFELGNL